MLISKVAKTGQKTNATDVKSRSFEIGDASMIIEILRKKLYSNPIQTLTQEYISNGRDANRESKSTRPIEIHIPTPSDLTLKIRDFGNGLTPERIAEVFVKYGNSTKRNSNNQTGGFGIGAKSAWAYTDSFTIISTVDGVAYHYVAHVTKEHAGSLDLVSETATDAPNGVEIQIGVLKKDLEDFVNAVDRTIGYWDAKESPKLFSDGEPDQYANNRVATIDRLGRFEVVSINSRIIESSIIVVVDGIPYPMPDDFNETTSIKHLTSILHNKRGLLHFETGEIEVAASREAITINDANKAAIESAAKQGLSDLKSLISKQIMACKSLKAALDTHKAISENYKHFKTYSLKFGKDAFQLGERGGLESMLFIGTIIREYSSSNSSYRSKGHLKVKPSDSSSIDFRTEKVFYSDDLTSHTNQNRRAKAQGDCYILSSDLNSANLKALATHLNLRGTSTLGPASVRASVSKKDKTDVILNHYVKTTSKQTVAKVVSLERNQTKYVYAVRKTDGDANGEFKALNSVIEACGLHFCLITQSTEKTLKGDANFISVNTFMKDYKKLIAKDKLNQLVNTLKDSILEGSNGYSYSGREHSIPLYKELSKQSLKDTRLTYAMSILSNVDTDKTLKQADGCSIRSGYGYRSDFNGNANIKKLIHAIPETKLYFEQEQLMQAFKKQYVLLQAVDAVEYGKVKSIPALTVYLNASFKGGK